MLDKLAAGAKYGQDLARVGSGVTRGENRAKKLNAAAWSGTWPAPGSTLDLDFANNRGFVRGSGQGGVMDAITYTRASSATFVGPDGLLKGSGSSAGALGRNLLTFPQDFDNAAWTKNGVVLSSRWLDPNEENQAFRADINASATGLFQLLSPGVVVGQQYTLSIWLRADSNTSINIGINGQTSGLNNGGVLVSITTQWQRYTYTITAGATESSLFAIVAATSLSGGGVQINTPLSVYVYGAQLEVGSTATTYYPTNVNVPRFDWGNTVQVPQRNLLAYTENFSSLGWTLNLVTVNAVVGSAPDGSVSHFLVTNSGVVIGSGNSSAGMLIVPFVNTNNNIFSIYVKSNGNRYFCIASGTFAARAFFDLQEGVVVSNNWNIGAWPITPTASITSEGGGWYRCSIYFPPGSLQTQICLFSSASTAGFPTSDGVNGVLLWRPQQEVGTVVTEYQVISYPTFSTPLAATPTVNGILIEESRTNNLLWCRDLTQSYTPTNKNWFQHSNSFTNTVWNFDSNQTQISRTSGFADPFGGSTATRIQPISGRTAANAYFGQRARTLYPATFSVYMKAVEYNFGVLALFSHAAGNFAVFDLNTGTILTAPTIAGLTASMESVGDGWHRCSLTVSAPELNRGFLISTSPNGTTSATANGTSGILIYGCQAENSAVMTTYEDTTALPIAVWTHDNVTVAKDQTGVDGVVGAASSVTATVNNAEIKQTSLLVASAYTSSVFLKRITGSGLVQVSLDGVTYSTVDLSDTEWRRISLSGTAANPSLGIRIVSSGDVIAVDYGQIEAFGASSPILTTSSITTRIADICSLFAQPDARIFDLSQFTAIAHFNITFRNNVANGNTILGLGTSNNNIFPTLILLDGRSSVGFVVPRATSLIPELGITYKVVLSYVQGTEASLAPRNNTAAINGVSFPIAQNISVFASVPIDRFGIGCTQRNPTVSRFLNGCISRVVLFPFAAATDAVVTLSS